MKKITKDLGFHLTFKTADLQDIINTTLADDSETYFDILFLYVPLLIPYAQTQLIFNDSIENSFTLSVDSWCIDRKTVDSRLEYQVQIGRAQKIAVLNVY